ATMAILLWTSVPSKMLTFLGMIITMIIPVRWKGSTRVSRRTSCGLSRRVENIVFRWKILVAGQVWSTGKRISMTRKVRFWRGLVVTVESDYGLIGSLPKFRKRKNNSVNHELWTLQEEFVEHFIRRFCFSGPEIMGFSSGELEFITGDSTKELT